VRNIIIIVQNGASFSGTGGHEIGGATATLFGPLFTTSGTCVSSSTGSSTSFDGLQATWHSGYDDASTMHLQTNKEKCFKHMIQIITTKQFQ
jgi:hypothetical protein